MVSFKSLKLGALALVAFQAITSFAQVEVDSVDESVENPDQTPNINVKVSAQFPQSEVFGVKLVNNHPTQCRVSIHNEETAPIDLMFVGGSIRTPIGVPGAPSPPMALRNLTTTRYGVTIPAGESETITYTFANEMHPQDVSLHLAAIIKGADETVFTLAFYNQTVSVVEAPTSFFDPQIIFLYLVLAGAFGGTCYFIYSTWITTFFPQKRGRGKGGERAKKSSQGSKTVDPADQVSVVGADGPAVTSGAKAYDESWIPAHHLQRPEAKRINSGAKVRSKSKQAQA